MGIWSGPLKTKGYLVCAFENKGVLNLGLRL